MQWIELTREGPVGVLTMNYEAENRFDRNFVGDLMEAFDTVEADDEIKAVVMTGGAEKFFSTGLHLQFMAGLAPEDLVEFIRYFNGMLARTCVFPKPLVAAINGHAIAAGAIWAAHMDFRYMRADRGWVSLPEVDINIPFLPGMIAIFREVMAPGPWRELALTGKKFSAPQAKELGYIDEVYEKDEVLPKSIEQAAMLAGKNLAAYAEIKRRMKGHVARIIEEEDPKYYGIMKDGG